MNSKLYTLLLLFLVIASNSHSQNNALHFDGVDDYVDLGAIPSTCDFSNGFTYTAWIRWDQSSYSSPLLYLANDSDDNYIKVFRGYDYFEIYLYHHGMTGAFGVGKGGALSNGVWTHIAITQGSGGQIGFYIDGTYFYMTNIESIVNVNRTKCFLGRDNYSNYFSGTMDEVSIWNRALSGSEILNAQENGFTGNETGLVAYYQFNQGTSRGVNTGIDTLHSEVTVPRYTGTLMNFALSGDTSNWIDDRHESSITPLDISLLRLSGSRDTLVIASDTTWTLTDTFNWLDFSKTSGKGNDTVIVTANSTNATGADLTAIINFLATGEIVRPITINQIGLWGRGTSDDPYLVRSVEDLRSISQNTPLWNCYFLQTQNIDAVDTRNWNDVQGFIPVGNFNSPFTGTYHGAGFTINRLCINQAYENYIGLFGFLSNAKIDSLNLRNVSINGGLYAGGLAGYAKENTVIRNCSVTGSITGWWRSGGLAGGTNNCKIDHCYASTNTSGDYICGGLVGETSTSAVTFSYASGAISGYFTGGLVGNLNNNSEINYCYSTCNINASNASGGIVGWNDNSIVKQCYTTGKISGSGYAGGIAGNNHTNGVIQNSYWNIETTNQVGACGQNSGILNDCRGLRTAYMRLQDSLINLGSFDTVWVIRTDSTYPALRNMNNAPFAFSDTLICHHAATSHLLANDYDYENIQNSLLVKVDMLSRGTHDSKFINLPDTLVYGDTVTASYRVGEFSISGDTLWGNQASCVFIYHNYPPVLSAHDTTIGRNSTLVITPTAINATDEDDGDTLSVIIKDGYNYTVNGNSLRPTTDFFGYLVVGVAVSDGIDTTAFETMLVYVTQATAIEDLKADEKDIYPNPCNDGFYISTTGNRTLYIFDLNGNLFISKQLTGNDYIDVRTLKAGVYLIKVDGQTYKLTKN